MIEEVKTIDNCPKLLRDALQTTEKQSTGHSLKSMWAPQEYHLHINHLGKRAVFLGVSRFQHIFGTIFLTFAYPLVDLFATRVNHRLPLYVTPVNDPAAWAFNLLIAPWWPRRFWFNDLFGQILSLREADFIRTFH
ncbi:hypothetical protein DPMN_057936 [Dreissena polymorpha]|uniref:Uncharacterized protein n=1 Tax=Dreissena polymorpha TaxID=45954 RepID=A0A9D4C122_DREPO|nr:hypothetical protein DPMN_057936 [Dreissena polymorpha]